MKKKILIIAGARPNFMKVAPLIKEFKKLRRSFNVKLVHTGQHYDFEMSEIFFENLNIPEPDIYLGIGSHTHAAQTAKIMIAFEKTVSKEKPDLVIVVGDVNSTAACALVCAKLHIKLAHVEAGLRSFDRQMPEEINRVVTDHLSDYLFVSEKSGLKNLKREGVSEKKTYFAGNVMIDTLLSNMKAIDRSGVLNRLGLERKGYSVLTLHRPKNVDLKKTLNEIYDIIRSVSRKINIIYPIHPRAKMMIKKHGLLKKFKALKTLTMIDPLGYNDFIKLTKESRFVLTDSGGIQEETTVLKVPCLTMRENTERPVTVGKGTNIIVNRSGKKILSSVNKILKGHRKRGIVPEKWDGRSAKRIVDVIKKDL